MFEIAKPDATGLPMQWRQVGGIMDSDGQDSNGEICSTIGVRSYDRDHAACLVYHNDKPHLALLRLAGAEVSTPVKIPLPAGFGMELGWRSSTAAGTIWFFIDNEKSSAAKRDWSLWRVDYGAGLPKAKRAAEAMRVTRLSEDRVMTEYAVLDYGPFALAIWQDAMNLKKPNVTRCLILHRIDKSETGKAGIPDWTAQPADGFLDDLPRQGLRQKRWMGRSVTVPEAPQFPSSTFKYGERFGTVVLCQYAEPFRSELTIGEIVFDKSRSTF